METQTLNFTLEKETKNSVRNAEQSDGKPPVVGTLYIQKWALGTEPPKALTVTIKAED